LLRLNNFRNNFYALPVTLSFFKSQNRMWAIYTLHLA
jgi:hypothetical protein